MANYIGEKLDFLMELTGTKNNTLAKALNIDPSYVSRIRNGSRGIPRALPFVEPASGYFAKRIREKYQIEAARDAIIPGEDWPMSSDVAAFVIASWLTEGISGYGRPLTGPAKAENIAADTLRPAANSEHESLAALPHSGEVALFYGNSGKRDADEILLLDAIALEKPTTLLLHSDENVAWLFEDPDWTKKWAALMIRFLQGGGRIRIVHDIGRDIGDMLGALKSWIPLYRYGGIEPYYLPRVRDGIYHRSLQIARGCCAVISDSVGGDTNGKLNILVRNKDALRALEREWTDFLALCRPLMEVYGANNRRGLRSRLKAFENSESAISVSPEAGIKVYYEDSLGAFVHFGSPDSPLGFLIREPRLATSIEEYIYKL